ncbi:MAG: hypothetical protein JRJ15_05545 [Deltaproteobacteria bacterium]|nr:hypothetical protein [Deltaproteobacteria bacterium]
MEAIIRKLINLQNCDLRLKDIKREKAVGPAKIKAFEDDLKRIEDQVNDELGEVDSMKRERRQIEQDIEDIENRIEKSKVKLANIKSNKEYTAALKEIDDLEREKTLSEDKVIEIMEVVEVQEKKCIAGRAKRDDYSKKFEEQQKEVQQELKALEQDLSAYETERVRIRKVFDEDLLRKYDSICEHKEGIGISAVIKGVCQSCHLGIPPQKFNELMRGDKMMNCPHCSRIIYWGEDERLNDKI